MDAVEEKQKVGSIELRKMVSSRILTLIERNKALHCSFYVMLNWAQAMTERQSQTINLQMKLKIRDQKQAIEAKSKVIRAKIQILKQKRNNSLNSPSKGSSDKFNPALLQSISSLEVKIEELVQKIYLYQTSSGVELRNQPEYHKKSVSSYHFAS